MVRTKADNCARKAVAAKAPRKNLGASSTAMKAGNSMKSPAGKKGKYGGGNPVCPRPTPEWQKEITNFMIRSPRSTTKQKENVNPDDEETTGAGCSKEDRTEEAQSSSSSRTEEISQGMEEENEDEDVNEEEEETEESSSATSSKRKFKKNNCISDSEDDD
ncbi:PCNA-associated factor-like [Patiria miniata]|uniref:PCNA-associated factor n=1 Tax=Patiria miniata TaxID=46514 RepID=A0A914BMS0_PATMI|nr:PCNA-associated factor-like [Patiria miniata]